MDNASISRGGGWRTRYLPNRARPTFYFNSDLKGFGLKVMRSGVRTFIVEYRLGIGGRATPKRRMTLGRAIVEGGREAAT